MKNTFASAFNRFKSAPKLIRICTYVLVSYAIYAGLLGLVVPAVLQSQAPKQLTEILGREVEISEVKINPFLLRAEINDVVIAKRDEMGAFVSVKQLKVEFNFWQSIVSLTPTLEYLTVQNPYIFLARLNGEKEKMTFNFSDIVQKLTTKQAIDSSSDMDTAVDEQEHKPTSDKLFAAKTHSISLSNGQVDFEDEQTGVELGYQNINFHLSELDTTAFTLTAPTVTESNTQTPSINSIANIYRLGMTGIDQSKLQIDGQFQLQPLEFSGDISLVKLQLAPLWPFTDHVIEAELSSGETSFASNYHLKQDNEQLGFIASQGQFSLADVIFDYKQQPKLKLPTLELTGISVDTTSQRIDLEKLSLMGLWIDGDLSNKGLDLQRRFTAKVKNTPPIVKDDSAGKEASTEKETSISSADETRRSVAEDKEWLVQLNLFDMQQTDINLKEGMVSGGVRWRVHPLNISVGPVSSDLSAPVDYTFDFGIASEINKQPSRTRGTFSSQGKLDIKAQELDSQVQLTGLELAQFQPYLDPHLNIILSQGSFSTKGGFSANSRGKAVYKGQVAIDQLLIKDVLQKEPLLKWTQMSIDSLIVDQADNSLKIKTILLNTPYAKVIVAKDLRTNIGAVSKSGAETTETESATPQPTLNTTQEDKQKTATSNKTNGSDLSVDIGKIQIVNGSAFYADYSLTPNFASGIESLEGFIKNISTTPDTKALVDIKGNIDKYAPVSLVGEINPLIESPYLDLDFSLNSVELTSVNPYSGTYAGYYIDKGQLSLDINYRLENNRLKGTNHVVVDQLILGKPSESSLATSLPVTLAIGLLQDGDGVIDLGFDVNGDVESPEFSFGGVILKALVNIVTKAITAPFSLLANLVGSDEELNLIQYKAGISVLDSPGQERLLKLVEALNARPNLRISVEGAVLLAEDSRALAETRLQNKLLKTSGLPELPEDFSASRIPNTGVLPDALQALFVQELKLDVNEERMKVEQVLIDSNEGVEVIPEQITTTLHIGMYNQLLNAQTISNTDLGSLAEERARAVKTFLIENEIDPGRVFILDSKSKLKTEQRQALMTIDAG
ncbi:DUF748 domain-containing protein [Vibrio sp. DW001]|uniref:DUF748 domain-containing protein n=1 Tax=Vibrio sp. DW001 TaxID=2912315 RepID=UPI0023AF8DE1|nr:DUF748 domain-containing protein [Vibrio sp. DW001]WED25396.1 DUF748 domain-containing protein [Vibrio sp. DW001]